MGSPTSNSTWSEAFILSGDSGLFLTNCSGSSSASSPMSGHRKHHRGLEDSDCDGSSISPDDSFDVGGMSNENFDTLKRGGLNSTDLLLLKHSSSPIEPPLEFQDSKPGGGSGGDFVLLLLEYYSNNLSAKIIHRALREYKTVVKLSSPPPSPPPPTLYHRPAAIHSLMLMGRPGYWTSELMPFSPSHAAARSSSRCSLGSSARLSSSHNSLSVPATHKVDDSSFITQAVSHDTLSTNQISDLYNVPFDSDMYAVPIDVINKPSLKPKRVQPHKKKRRNTASGCRDLETRQCRFVTTKRTIVKSVRSETKRHSVAGTSAPVDGEPIHMTLQEVRQYLQTLYSSSSDSSDQKDKICELTTATTKSPIIITNNNNNNNNNNTSNYNKYQSLKNNLVISSLSSINNNKGINITNNNTSINNNNNNNNNNNINTNNNTARFKKSTFLINLKNKKVKDSSCDNNVNGKQITTNNNLAASPTTTTNTNNNKSMDKINKKTSSSSSSTPAKFLSFKQTLCNMFRFRKFLSPEHSRFGGGGVGGGVKGAVAAGGGGGGVETNNNPLIEENTLSSRALPPLPLVNEAQLFDEQTLDFATSIQRVKDYGWYWGPLSSEAAEKILSNEPDGSFIVRDSSADHYIFSLTFKLNNCVRHVRIDHDQGNFSFGCCTKFKSQTIVEFIENAVEHSRSGRYLFFLHRRPVIGPIRVQLLHPVSRFKQVQSLQHICRFVIHKAVRRDLIPNLPLPRRMIDYVNTPHYYSEHLIDIDDSDNNGDGGGGGGDVDGIDGEIALEISISEQENNNVHDEEQQPAEAAAAAMLPVNNYIVFNHNNNNNNDSGQS